MLSSRQPINLREEVADQPDVPTQPPVYAAVRFPSTPLQPGVQSARIDDRQPFGPFPAEDTNEQPTRAHVAAPAAEPVSRTNRRPNRPF